jgi:hypothetical protein
MVGGMAGLLWLWLLLAVGCWEGCSMVLQILHLGQEVWRATGLVAEEGHGFERGASAAAAVA